MYINLTLVWNEDSLHAVWMWSSNSLNNWPKLLAFFFSLCVILLMSRFYSNTCRGAHIKQQKWFDADLDRNGSKERVKNEHKSYRLYCILIDHHLIIKAIGDANRLIYSVCLRFNCSVNKNEISRRKWKLWPRSWCIFAILHCFELPLHTPQTEAATARSREGPPTDEEIIDSSKNPPKLGKQLFKQLKRLKTNI